MALSSPDKFLLILLKKQDFLVVSNYMGKIVMELKGEEKVLLGALNEIYIPYYFCSSYIYGRKNK